ncbi:pentatricopeptide repeat (PPR) superfamily protein [Striga asiatica]|uniref:Pentatricopeptide repeat (PPR) superfamily protein n=1 Tax=Striga asiatica TaxID=4170 RepID=A0A5A7Q649_STRAF|nr:pentatricopeptide repeat (PPR) superfamily protein [Striga asiatica]
MFRTLCDAGRWRDVKTLIRKMADHNICFDGTSCSVLMAAFSQKGMVEEAEGVLEIMAQINDACLLDHMDKILPCEIEVGVIISGACFAQPLMEITVIVLIQGALKEEMLSSWIGTSSDPKEANNYLSRKSHLLNHVEIDFALCGRMPDRRWMNNSAGLAFTPHVPRVADGEDSVKLYNRSRSNTQQHFLNIFTESPYTEFNRILSDLVRVKDISVVVKLVNEMCVDGIPVDEFTMTIAINCYCLSGRVPKEDLFMVGQVGMAQELYKGILKTRICNPDDIFENSGHNPDIYTYSALINDFVQEARIDEAHEVMVQMLAKGVHPDVVTYTSILQGLSDVGRWKDVRALLASMRDRKVEESSGILRPNTILYNMMVGSLCCAHVEEASRMMKKMETDGCAPDDATYNVALQGLLLEARNWDSCPMLLLVRGEGFREKIKGEEEIWRDANTGGQFLEFDDGDDDVIGGHHGFLKEISDVDQFPFIEGFVDIVGFGD